MLFEVVLISGITMAMVHMLKASRIIQPGHSAIAVIGISIILGLGYGLDLWSLFFQVSQLDVITAQLIFSTFVGLCTCGAYALAKNLLALIKSHDKRMKNNF